MQSSVINGLSLPEFEDQQFHTELNNSIRSLDEIKIQKISAVYDQATNSIKMGEEILTFEKLLAYNNSQSYDLSIAHNDILMKCVHYTQYEPAVPPTEEDPGKNMVPGVLVYGGMYQEGNSKFLIVQTENGINISSITYTSGGFENEANKVIELNDSVTDTQYPSAKAVYDYTNNEINKMATHYITKNAAGDPFATKSELDATTVFYHAGQIISLTEKDYCIVEIDETHENMSARYMYDGGNWLFLYTYDKNYTEAQQAALDSGATAEKVAEYDEKILPLEIKEMEYKEVEVSNWNEFNTDEPKYASPDGIVIANDKVIIAKGAFRKYLYSAIVLSNDGLNYYFSGKADEISIKYIAYGAGVIVGIATDGKRAVYSTDNGNTWNNFIISDYSSIDNPKISFANDKFYITFSNVFVYSYDGINWSERSVSGSSVTLDKIVYGNGIYLTTAGYRRLAISTDGINWTTNEIGIDTKIFYVNEKFYAIFPTNNYYLHYSIDGINWYSTNYKINGYGIKQILFVNNKYIIFTTIKTIIVTEDFNDIEQINIDYNVNDATYFNNMFILTGGGKILYSNTLYKIISKYISQQDINITNNIKQLLSKYIYPSNVIYGVSGTDYGQQSNTFTGIKYIWYGPANTKPDATTQALYKNTVFCTPEDNGLVTI